MITKTLGAVILAILCLFFFPVAIALVAGVFGIAVGVIGAVGGAILGVFGAIFGGVFSGIGWLFGDWDGDWPFGFFNCNMFTVAAIIIVVALATRNKRRQQ